MFVMVLGLFGTLVVGGLLLYLSTTVQTRGNDSRQVQGKYSADAGLEAVMADLLRGLDPLAGGYVAPSPTVNGFQAAVTVSAGTGAPLPASNAITAGLGCTLSIGGTTSYADYLITSLAGNVTLRAYVRQCPGPAFVTQQQLVTVQSLSEG